MEVNQGWRQSIIRQVKDRNTQAEQFRGLIKHNNLLSHRNYQLERELTLLKQNFNESGGRKSSGGPSTSSPHLNDREETPAVRKLKEELTVCYKRLSDNAQSILDLNKQIKEQSDAVKHKMEEIELWKRKQQTQDDVCKRLQEEITEKDIVVQVLREELQALQIELVKNEEKSERLSSENQELVNRWLRKANEEADKMNEGNKLFQSAFATPTRGIDMSSAQLSASFSGSLSRANSMLGDKGGSTKVAAVVPTAAKKLLGAHKGEVNIITYNATGTSVASAGADKFIRVSDPATGTSKTTLSGATAGITALSFSPNDEFVLGADSNANQHSTIRLWSSQQGRLKTNLSGHIAKITSAVFTSDSQKIITGSHDRTLKIWDLVKGYCVKTIFCFSSCNDLCLSSDGNTIISGHLDNTLRFWDVRLGEQVKELDSIHTKQITSVCLSPSGNSVLTSSRDNLHRIVDTSTYQVVTTLSSDKYKNAFNWTRSCFSPDAAYAAAGGADGGLFIWNVSNASLTPVLSGKHKNSIACVFMAPCRRAGCNL